MSSLKRSGLRSQRSKLQKTINELNASKQSLEEERVVLRRSGLRSHFQKTLEKASRYLEEEQPERAKLYGFKKSLERLVEQLDAIDKQVLQTLNPDSVE